VVVLSLAEYESLQETAHLLRSPANAKRLLKSIESARARKGNPEAIESGRVKPRLFEGSVGGISCLAPRDPRTVARINQLIKEIMRDPYRGIGKPEPLKHALRGYWSRRINAEHRIVYRVEGDLWICALRYHLLKLQTFLLRS